MKDEVFGGDKTAGVEKQISLYSKTGQYTVATSPSPFHGDKKTAALMKTFGSMPLSPQSTNSGQI